MTEREEFFTKLTALAGMVSNFVLTPAIVALYDQSLSPLGYEPLCRALEQIILNRSSRDPFPSIAEIRKLIEPEVSERDDAVLFWPSFRAPPWPSSGMDSHNLKRF